VRPRLCLPLELLTPVLLPLPAFGLELAPSLGLCQVPTTLLLSLPSGLRGLGCLDKADHKVVQAAFESPALSIAPGSQVSTVRRAITDPEGELSGWFIGVRDPRSQPASRFDRWSGNPDCADLSSKRTQNLSSRTVTRVSNGWSIIVSAGQARARQPLSSASKIRSVRSMDSLVTRTSRQGCSRATT